MKLDKIKNLIGLVYDLDIPQYDLDQAHTYYLYVHRDLDHAEYSREYRIHSDYHTTAVIYDDEGYIDAHLSILNALKN